MTRPDMESLPTFGAEGQCTACVEAKASATYRLTVPCAVFKGAMDALIYTAREQ